MQNYVERCKPMGLYYDAADTLAVEQDGEVVNHLPCERMHLDYPRLTARGEACMGRTSDGDI